MCEPLYALRVLSAEDKGLSPGDLVNEDGKFTVSPNDFFAVNQYVANGTSLPINAVEMRRVLGIPETISLPEEFNDIYPVYQNVRTHTENYRKNIFPSITTTTINLKKSVARSIAVLNTVLENLRLIGARSILPDNEKMLIVKSIKTALEALVEGKNGTRAYNEQLASSSAQLRKFIVETTEDELELGVLHGNILATFNKDVELLEAKNKQIAEINRQIAQLTTSMQHAATAWNFIRLIPVIGVVAEAIYKQLSPNIQHQIETLKQELATRQDSYKRDLAVSGLIQRVETQSGTLQKQAQAALQGLAKISGTWTTMEKTVAAITELENDAFLEPLVGDLLFIDVQTSLKLWEGISLAVDQFATAANIEPPKDLATINLFTDPYENIVVQGYGLELPV